ncbi:T9SS type A sorting domain-containing protein [Flavobacterium sp. J27]|uniref:T9SS type A sorting domain-containing protein n=1 Tax=Flavobacterium sp. J27 TaxID=2060419 RepID=UPI00102F511F|nr:T9SS type A sorting domain-containing protein [Flavobacterium sp. J27]
MKTKLLFLSISLLLYSVTIIGQTKTWDFGNDETTWPIGNGYNTNTIVDNLGIEWNVNSPTASNVGVIESSPKTFTDGYVGANRFKLNGAGYSGSTFQVMPTQRYVYFATAGNCTIKVWFRTGGSGTRTLYITDGTSTIGSLGSNVSGDPLILEATYTGSATNLYIYGDQSNNLYKIEVTGALGTTTLDTDIFKNGLNVNAYATNSQIFISNIISNTQINIYTLTGQLVRSLNTSTDINFELNKGFYIVNVVSSEGNKKSFKIII